VKRIGYGRVHLSRLDHDEKRQTGGNYRIGFVGELTFYMEHSKHDRIRKRCWAGLDCLAHKVLALRVFNNIIVALRSRSVFEGLL
jgi:hypothetical protein